jgi:hypothetical protein
MLALSFIAVFTVIATDLNITDEQLI